MGKAAKRKPTTNAEGDPAQDYLAMFDARSQLITASLNLGWQLALTVLILLFIGVKLDQRFDTAPSLSLTALFLAVVCSAALISKAFKDATAQQDMTNTKIKPKRMKNSKGKKNV
jgi:hypothetical protein